MYEAKLILVGEERAGKSTIAKALLRGDDFKFDTNEKSTEGIDVLKWIIPKDKTKTPKDFRFNIWDFGGQEIYHTTHQFFLNQRSLYLFVTEAHKDLRFDDFYYWLNIINSLGGDSPVLAVKNKIDQSSASNDISTYKKLFPQLINDNLIGISCNTAHENWATEYMPLLNIFKEKIYEVVKNKQIDSMGTPLPKTWVQVREAITKLQDQGKDYISLADYQTICKQYNLDDTTISSLSQLFHDLGVFLHFQDNIKLRNTIFINHEYVTQGVYKIFDNQHIIDSKGKFTEQDLIASLQNTPYEYKQAELLSLCEEFKILFKKEDIYLAPQLFREKKPAFDWDFTDNLHYKYSYDFMPKGIVSSLIVAIYKKIYQHHYWRYGAIFHYKDNFALVQEKRLANTNEISIMIKGKKRHELFNIIHNQLNNINNKFAKLIVNEKIGCICEECRNSITPYYFSLERIEKALRKNKRSIECQKSFEDIEIIDLLDYSQIQNIMGDTNTSGIQQDIKSSSIEYNTKLKQVRTQIANNATYKASKNLIDLSNNKTVIHGKIILYHSQLKQIEEEKKKGTITISEINEKIKDINKDLLSIVEELQRNELISEESRNVFIDNDTKNIMPFAIKQVLVENFKGIKHIQVSNIPVDAQWIFLTGENGYGKTSFLQAIVIGLIGKDDINFLKEKRSEKNEAISIEYLYEGKSEINNLNSPIFSAFYNFAAYGSSRLITQGQEQAKDEKMYLTYSIFNDDGILKDIESKLLTWHYKKDKRFDSVKNILINLLQNISDIIIKESKDKNEEDEVRYVECEPENNQSTYPSLLFKDLAAGYKSIIAMVGDMIIRLLENQSFQDDLKELSGIVIIDEFDLHLHPKWQKKFVEILTDEFPKIQFIVSTHSAIPLLGAPKNSIFLNVDRTVKEGITVQRVDIDIKNLLPNSLLTSPLFDFQDIMSNQYNREKDDVHTENYFSEIQLNKEIDKRLKDFVKRNKTTKKL